MADGVLIIDKPGGLTSHDVVGRLRRALGMRRIGHAGTLDPMATGVLVVLVGEATKLGGYLTSQDKRYRATIAFGDETDSLDADGRVIRSVAVSSATIEVLGQAERDPTRLPPALERALLVERSRTEQVPPAVSAIKVDGKRSYARARQGEEVVLPPRAICVHELSVVDATADPPSLTVEMEVSKGFYVRALARDLAETFGAVAHLTALRRLSSGPFHLRDAVALDAPTDALAAALIPMSDAATRALARAQLSDEGVIKARCGKPMAPEDFEAPPPVDAPSAWLDRQGKIVAIGAVEEGRPVVRRGFQAPKAQ